MTRRDLFCGAAALLVTRPSYAAKSHIAKSSVSAITDEIGGMQSDAIAFARRFGLQWVELRTVPESKKEFAFLTEPELKRFAAELAANKLKVSLLKTSLLKFPWPDEAAATGDKARWDRRKDDLSRAITAAQILGVDKIRLFTGARQPNPQSASPRIVQTMEELIPLADSAKMRLVIENEPSQNIATCAELKAILDLLPSKTIAFNWDPQNALTLHETPWPDGYAQLPKARMVNVQIKAESLDPVNWRALMEGLQKDNYRGTISLATEIFDGTFEKASDAMREVLHIAGELS